MSKYQKRESWPFVELDAPETIADDLGAALLDFGSTGIEQRDGADGAVTLVAYFETAPSLDDLAAAIGVAPGIDPEQARAAAATLRAGATDDDDWLRLWKRGFEPVPIGARLLVYPSWKRAEADVFADRVKLEVDPGQAFGTGTHETTRLCLEWLDEFWRGGTLVDVGTGTGILAIAAALLAPGSTIVAVDIDPLAVDIAVDNARANGLGGKIRFEPCGPDGVDGVFDVVIANLTADVILDLQSHLLARLADRGRIVLSGILTDQAASVLAAMRTQGLALEARSDLGEWTALVCRRL